MRVVMSIVVAALLTIPVSVQSAAAPAPSTGPAWWRVADADSEVWIIGTPDRLPIYTRWNDQALDMHMQGAKRLIVPPSPNSLRPERSGDLNPVSFQPLYERLPADLYGKVALNLERADARRTRMGYPPARGFRDDVDSSRTYLAAALMTGGLVDDWRTGNPVSSQAKGYAMREWPNIQIETLNLTAAGLVATANASRLPEAVQVACVRHIADGLAGGQVSTQALRAGIGAWARGDVERSLRHYDFLAGCAYGNVGQAFWSRLVNENMGALERALATPGKSVAVIELDPLLMRGGVLERLRATGRQVEQVGGAGSAPRNNLRAATPAARVNG